MHFANSRCVALLTTVIFLSTFFVATPAHAQTSFFSGITNFLQVGNIGRLISCLPSSGGGGGGVATQTTYTYLVGGVPIRTGAPLPETRNAFGQSTGPRLISAQTTAYSSGSGSAGSVVGYASQGVSPFAPQYSAQQLGSQSERQAIARTGGGHSFFQTFREFGSCLTDSTTSDEDDANNKEKPETPLLTASSQLPPGRCSDGFDNDDDGLVDFADPDCVASAGISEFSATPSLPPGPVAAPIPDLVLTVPSLVRRGATVQVSWGTQNVSSCLPVAGTNGDSLPHVNLDNTFRSPVGGLTSSPITERTTYTLQCIDFAGVAHTRNATVNITPNWRER